MLINIFVKYLTLKSPASEASREVENFDWRKKHTPIHIWCQGIRDSVCLSQNSTQLSLEWLNRTG
jgi:hypothetical protein